MEILVNSLQDSNRLSNAESPESKLHVYALGRLQKIGPEYPQVSLFFFKRRSQKFV